MSNTKDKCYVSIAGNADGELWLTDYRETDPVRKLREWGEYHEVTLFLSDIFTPLGYQDALKFSGALNVRAVAGIVRGGTEDVIDINHCTNVKVSITSAQPKGKYLATIKGGSEHITLAILENEGHGTETDIDIGNWSDQGREPTVLVELAAGSGVGLLRVRVINGDVPDVSPEGKFKVSTWLRGWFPVVQRIWKYLGGK